LKVKWFFLLEKPYFPVMSSGIVGFLFVTSFVAFHFAFAIAWAIGRNLDAFIINKVSSLFLFLFP